MNVEVRREDDGSYWATATGFPGVFATGDSLAELRVSLAEGISLWLAQPGGPAPVVTIDDLTLDEPLRSLARARLAVA